MPTWCWEHKPTTDEVDQCRFSAWFPLLQRHSVASRILPLTEPALEYLKDSGSLFLPAKSDAAESDEKKALDAEAANLSHAHADVIELAKTITAAIESLGGAVMCKLNWSAPKDATWIGLNHSMICHSAEDVFLLLKSSECVQHDLSTPYRHCTQEPEHQMTAGSYELVLRHWLTMPPSREFRCFVSRKRLFAITQRHEDAFDSDVQSGADDIKSDIFYFFSDHLRDSFPLSIYTFDVFVEESGRIWLLDVNPLFSEGDHGLFDWEDISELEHKRHFHLVDTTEYTDDEEVERFLMEQKKKEQEAQGLVNPDDAVDDNQVVPMERKTQVEVLNKKLLNAFRSALEDPAQAEKFSQYPTASNNGEDNGVDPSEWDSAADRVDDDDDNDDNDDNDAADHDDSVCALSQPPSAKKGDHSEGKSGEQLPEPRERVERAIASPENEASSERAALVSAPLGRPLPPDSSEEESEPVQIERVFMRVLTEQPQLRAGKFASSAFPRDVVELAATGDVNLVIKALKEAQQHQLDETDDDDDDDDDDDNDNDDSKN